MVSAITVFIIKDFILNKSVNLKYKSFFDKYSKSKTRLSNFLIKIPLVRDPKSAI